MKQLILFSIFSFIFSIIRAQDQEIPKINQNGIEQFKKLMKEKNLHFNPKINPPNNNDFFESNSNVQSKLLFETKLGKVYAMQPDNMRCLKPNYFSNMPVDIHQSGIYIPNPLHYNK